MKDDKSLEFDYSGFSVFGHFDLKAQQSPEICEDLISYYEANNFFWKIEPLVVHFGINRISKFLDKWKNHVDDEEYSIVACRMALLYSIFDIDSEFLIPLTNQWSSYLNFRPLIRMLNL